MTVSVIVVIAAFGLLGYQNLQQANRISQQQKELQASCKFFRDLGGVSIPASTKPKPTKLGVSIVIDANIASKGLKCSGPAKIGPSVLYWQRYYHIKEAQ